MDQEMVTYCRIPKNNIVNVQDRDSAIFARDSREQKATDTRIRKQKATSAGFEPAPPKGQAFYSRLAL